MTKDEGRRTKEIRSPNVEKLSVVRSQVSSYGFRHSFGFRHSSFGFENCSLFNQKAGQWTGESGRGGVGSWKATALASRRASRRIFACHCALLCHLPRRIPP